VATKARRAGSLAGILNANTSSGSNTIVIDSGGDISLSGSLTVSGTVTGYATNTYLQSTFAQNTYISGLGNDRLQVANAEALYVTKATALTSNNALINLINDRYQVANADATFLTKSVALTTNTALLGLINDRIQAANVSSTLGLYWPSANVITYTDSAVSGSTKTVNTSIYVASGGENKIAIPYTNTNFLLVYLNGVLLTEDTDYVAANNVHIGGIDPVLSQGDVLVVEEYKNHNANTVNRSAGGGGGGGFSLQGSTSGYKAGGASITQPYSSTMTNVIDKFPFASEGTGTDVGDLADTPLSQTGFGVGHSSSTDGYTSRYGQGGYSCVQKYSFASDGNGTIIGSYPTGYRYVMPENSSTHGYHSGGTIEPPVSPYFSNSVNHINKFPFSAETTTSDVGDLTQARGAGAGASSTTYGYAAGGCCTSPSSGCSNVIDKFPFASDTNATDVGDLSLSKHNWEGVSGPEAGYAVAETNGNSILKWPFTSDTNSTDVGDLLASPATPNYGLGYQGSGAGTQSSTKGYLQSGKELSPNFGPITTTKIQAWPFASDTNATCVGDVSQDTQYGSGAQV
jgi:hypothetical protein